MTSGAARPFIVSICVGRPITLSGDDTAGAWTTGIFKVPVDGARLVTPTGMEGDGQADLENHGGPDKAVCAYSADHYADWRATLGIARFDHGAFGENLTIAGLVERAVCIGDIWAVGDAHLQISQPRQPCWKLARKWNRASFPNEVTAAGRTGWYFRVVRPGAVTPGASVSLVSRVHPEWTIEAANRVMHERVGDTAALAALDALSSSWRQTLSRRLPAGR